MKDKKKINILSLVAFFVVVLVGLLATDSTDGILFDKQIMGLIHRNTSLRGISLMKAISLLGSPIFFISIGIGFFIYFMIKKNARNVKLTLWSLGGSYLLNASLKLIFSRTRPINYMLIPHSGYSFPSGHSMVSMSFYTMLTYILLENTRDKKISNLYFFINFTIIGLIGFSRIYLGVHWPTDVIVGFILGFIFFIIGKILIKE